MKAKLYKVLDQYHLYDGDKAIATTIVGNPMLLPNLSKQNCDEIFGVVDVDKLADEEYSHYYFEGRVEIRDGFRDGFNKAMELNKDKVYTLEDMSTMMLEAVKWANDGGEINARKLLYNTIQSLQQPTEIDVEIEMEVADLAFYENGNRYPLKADIPERFKYKPRLDSEGCLILKKI
jgi:hypothetical protein